MPTAVRINNLTINGARWTAALCKDISQRKIFRKEAADFGRLNTINRILTSTRKRCVHSFLVFLFWIIELFDPGFEAMLHNLESNSGFVLPVCTPQPSRSLRSILDSIDPHLCSIPFFVTRCFHCQVPFNARQTVWLWFPAAQHCSLARICIRTGASSNALVGP